ncbi:MAG: sigma 54-interacting transcriptional regulator [Planctomycetota bacterium]
MPFSSVSPPPLPPSPPSPAKCPRRFSASHSGCSNPPRRTGIHTPTKSSRRSAEPGAEASSWRHRRHRRAAFFPADLSDGKRNCHSSKGFWRRKRIRAQIAGWRFVRGEGAEEGVEAYRHWRDILRELVYALGPEASPVGKFAPVLSRILPNLFPETPPPAALEGSAGKVRLLDSLASFVVEAASHWPLALFLDDLQWADQGSLDLLIYLLRHLKVSREENGELPLLVFAASRAGEELEKEEVASLLNSMFGKDSVPGPFMDKVMSASRGNPLFVEEILRYLASRGTLRWAGLRWVFPKGNLEALEIPANLERVMGGMVEGLGEEEVRALEAMAVYGAPVQVGTLGSLEETLGGEGVLRALRALLRRGLVEQGGSSRGWAWRIRQVLLARFLIEQMGKDRRLLLHAKSGEFLLKGNEKDLERLERASHHLLSAQEGKRGIPLALEVAGKLKEIHQYERALDLLSSASRLVGAEDWEKRAEIHREMGKHNILSGNMTAGLKEYEEAGAALVRAGGDRTREIFELYLEGGRGLQALGRREEGRALFEKSEELAQEMGDGIAQARARLGKGMCMVYEGRFEEQRALIEGTLAEYPSLEEENEGAMALYSLATAVERQGETSLALAHLDKAEAIFRKRERKKGVAAVIRFRGYIYRNEVRFEEARQCFETSLALGREVGDRKEVALSHAMLANLHYRMDRYREANENLKEALAIVRVTGDEAAERGFLDYRAAFSVSVGEYAEAVSLQKENVAFWKAKGLTFSAAVAGVNLANLFLRTGNLPDALRSFREAWGTIREVRDNNAGSLLYRGLGDLLLRRGKYASALTFYKKLREGSEPDRENIVEWGAQTEAAVALIRLGRVEEAENTIEGAGIRIGILKREKGEFQTAREEFEIGLKRAEEKGQLPLQILGYSEMGEAALLSGRPGIARAFVTRAAALNAGVGGRLDAAGILRRMAAVYRVLGKADRALETATEALSLARASRSLELTGLALEEAGSAELALGAVDRARPLFDEAMEVHRRTGYIRGRAQVLLALRSGWKEDASTSAWAAELEAILERCPFDDLRARRDLLEAGLLASGNAGREWVEGLLASALEKSRRINALGLAWEAHEASASYARDREIEVDHARAALEITKALEEGIPEEDLPGFRARLESIRRELATLFGGRSAMEGLMDRDGIVTAAGGEMEKAALVAMLKVAKRLSTERRLPVLLDGIVDSAVSLFGGQRGFLLLEKEGELEAKVARNYRKEEDAELEFSATVAEEVIQTGRGLCYGNVMAEGGFPGSKSVRDLRLKSILCSPLRSSGKVLGALYIDHPEEEGVFRERDLGVLQALADLAGLAIEDARLHDRLKAYERELERKNLELQKEVGTQAVELGEIRGRLRAQERELKQKFAYENIVSQSAAMEGIFRLLDRVTESDLPVLIQGETGTGKELVARAIHFNGPRTEKPFLTVNCTAIPESLLESELFGYVKGAFTGAVKDEPGLFVTANGGSLLLDEIGDMDRALQAKLLRVVQEGEVRPLGGKSAIPVDVRIICTTNRDMQALVTSGDFREDLFYRLNVVSVTLPPLRDRREDVPLLSAHFLKENLENEGRRKEEFRFSKGALEALTQYAWPGNIRQLKNLVEKIVLLSSPGTLSDKDIRAWLTEIGEGKESPLEGPRDFKEGKMRFESEFVKAALRRNLGNISKAAREAKIDRAYFYRLMRKYGIDAERYKAK